MGSGSGLFAMPVAGARLAGVLVGGTINGIGGGDVAAEGRAGCVRWR